MTLPRWTRTLAALALAGLIATGCSDEGDEAEAGDTGADVEAAAGDAGDGAGASSGECAGTELTVTNLATGETTSLADPFAHTMVDDTLYNIYATDYGLGSDDLDGYTPEPEGGQNAVIIAINAFGAGDGSELEPLQVGEEIEWTSTGDGTTKALLVTLVTSEENYNQAASPHAGGTVTITGVGGAVCGEIDYRDADKELTGTFEAPVTG